MNRTMKAYILTFVICLAAPLAGFAQREVPDTISLRCDSLAKSINIGGLVKSDNLTSYIGPTFQYAPENTPLSSFKTEYPRFYLCSGTSFNLPVDKWGIHSLGRYYGISGTDAD